MCAGLTSGDGARRGAVADAHARREYRSGWWRYRCGPAASAPRAGRRHGLASAWQTRVAACVETSGLSDARACMRSAFTRCQNACRVMGRARAGQEHGLAEFCSCQRRTRAAQIALQPFAGLFAQWHDALLDPLPEHAHHPLVEIHLRHSITRPAPTPSARWRTASRASHGRADPSAALVSGASSRRSTSRSLKLLGKLPPEPRGLDLRAGVRGDTPLAQQVLKKSSQAG